MSFAEVLCGMLAYISGKLVLAKGIWFEVSVEDSQVDIREAQYPQKVKRLFLAKQSYGFMADCSL